MSNTSHNQSLGATWIIPVMFFSVTFFILTNQVNAKTIISNSVTVTADSTGESHASVTTILNGETVEDWSETSSSSINYTHEFSTSTVPTIEDSPLSSPAPTHDQLVVLIKRLQALISLYVSLLHN